MPLSEEEQRLLDEMERNLYSDRTDVHSSSSKLGRVSGRGIALGLLGIVLGIIGLAIGVSTGFVVWGLVGFALMLGGCIAALSLRERPGTSRGSGNASSRSRAQASRGFMQRLEDRWDDQAR